MIRVARASRPSRTISSSVSVAQLASRIAARRSTASYSSANATETAKAKRPEGNSDGPLAGEVAVSTGALSIPRRLAANLAARAGCQVDSGVTKDTTLLIVGDLDVGKLAPGQSKSSKQLKAEALIAKGQFIRILRESDFLEIVDT